MNPYEELAGYRFASGRDYDKRSVETFRARVLNLVDDLLNQVTQLQDEVADLRERSRAPLPDPLAATAAPAVPTSWLDALAGTGEPPAVGADPLPAEVAEAPPAVVVSPAAFPAPALGSWLADLEASPDDLDDDDVGAGSTAELLLAAAGNAVAVQAAALAGRKGEPLVAAPAPEPAHQRVPPAPLPQPPHRPSPAGPGTAAPAGPAWAPGPSESSLPAISPIAPASIVITPVTVPATPAAEVERPPVVPAPPDAPIGLWPVDGGPVAAPAPAQSLTVMPGATVIAEPPPITELSRLPIVLDDGLPTDDPLPSPVRHWGGWIRDATRPDAG